MHGGLLKKPITAVSEHFPKAKISKKNALLSKVEFAELVKLSKVKPKSKIFTYYQIVQGSEVRYAIQTTTYVRSKNMTALIFIDGNGVVSDIELLAFYEPPEYQPPQKWLATFKEKSLADAIMPRRDIPVISGATLSANAMSRSTRLALAFWKVKLH